MDLSKLGPTNDIQVWFNDLSTFQLLLAQLKGLNKTGGRTPTLVDVDLGNQYCIFAVSTMNACTYLLYLVVGYIICLNLDVSKNRGGFTPQYIHLFVGLFIIFTIHFGGNPPIFGNTHLGNQYILPFFLVRNMTS